MRITSVPQGLPLAVPDLESDQPRHFHEIGDLFQSLRRNGRRLLLWVLCCTGLAGVYILNAKPEYMATTQVALEPVRLTLPSASTEATLAYQSMLDAAQADSRMQVVKSERNLRYVFDTLRLADTPEFAVAGKGLVTRLRELVFGGAAEPTRAERENAALLVFMNKVAVRRIGQSYVLEISYRAPSPALAARTANAITMAYIRDQVMSARRGNDQTRGRLDDIADETRIASQAVLEGRIPDAQFPDSDARVIAAAIEPTAKAYPQVALLLGLAITFGLFSGLGLVTIRHSLDRTVRSRRHVTRALGVDCISTLPFLTRRLRKRRLRYVPFCSDTKGPFFDALRLARATVVASSSTLAHSSVGIVSCRRGEGKSTIAGNLAYLLAASGQPVTLIDANFKHPSLTDALAPNQEQGLSEALMERLSPDAIAPMTLWQELHFIPAVARATEADVNVYMGSAEMRSLLSILHTSTTVIVDLPSLCESTDAHAVGPVLDGLLFVIEAERTSIDEAGEAMAALRARGANVLGVIINKLGRAKAA